MCVFQLVVIKMESHQRRLNRTATESLIPVLWGRGRLGERGGGGWVDHSTKISARAQTHPFTPTAR